MSHAALIAAVAAAAFARPATLEAVRQAYAAAADNPPVVRYTLPLAVAPGYAGRLTLRGARLDGLTQVTAASGVTAKVVGKARKAPPQNVSVELAGDTELDVELTVAKEFTNTSTGLATSGPVSLSLRGLPVVPNLVAEQEPNNGFAAAQKLTVPFTLHGTIDKPKDADVFRFDGKAGDKLKVEVKARALGSPVDALLTLFDADRRIVESCDDMDGAADPAFTVTLTKDGVYYLSVIDSHDQGGGICPYLLSVTRAK